MKTPQRQLECTVPVLTVRDLSESISFYTETLGFKLDWGAGANSAICSVSRDGCPIMLSQSSDKASAVWVWIGLEDASLFDELTSKGMKVFRKLQNHPWAYEMKFEDIDGNVLWFGTEPRKDLPFFDCKQS